MDPATQTLFTKLLKDVLKEDVLPERSVIDLVPQLASVMTPSCYKVDAGYSNVGAEALSSGCIRVQRSGTREIMMLSTAGLANFMSSVHSENDSSTNMVLRRLKRMTLSDLQAS